MEHVNYRESLEHVAKLIEHVVKLIEHESHEETMAKIGAVTTFVTAQAAKPMLT